MRAVIARDPFARHDVIRETVPTDERTPCAWCGSRPGRFRYGIHEDSGRVHVDERAFCSVGCWRNW